MVGSRRPTNPQMYRAGDIGFLLARLRLM